MRRARFAVAALLIVTGTAAHRGQVASAAPVTTPIALSLTFEGIAPISVSGVATVDVTGCLCFDQLHVAAGAIALGAPVTIPVTSTTAISQLRVSRLSNQSGTFSRFWTASQTAYDEACGLAGPGVGEACNDGDWIGGLMGLTGTIHVSVIPNVVVVPVNLNSLRVGQGGAATSGAFSVDAAGWSVGTGLVNMGDRVVAGTGSWSRSVTGLTFVTPTYVSMLGVEMPTFGSLRLDNVHMFGVPEPGSVVLMAIGVAGLLLSGRQRNRRSAPPS